MGERPLGVRWSSPGLADSLRQLVALPSSDGDAPPNISVVVGQAEGRTRTKHQLYLQGQSMLARSTDGGLIRAILRGLASIAVEPRPGTLRLRAVLVVGPDGSVTAVDRRLSPTLERLEPRLRRSGHQVISLPGVDVDPQSSLAHLPEVLERLGVAAADLEQGWPAAGTDDDLRAGQLEVERVVYGGHPEAPSLATSIAEMVPLLWDETGRVRTGDVAQLAVLARRIEHVGVPGNAPALLRAALRL